jgi:hypothetical protein
VPPNQQLQSLGDMMESKYQKYPPLNWYMLVDGLHGEANPAFLAAANEALREYPSYLLENSTPEVLASFLAARADWALHDRREWNFLPRLS